MSADTGKSRFCWARRASKRALLPLCIGKNSIAFCKGLRENTPEFGEVRHSQWGIVNLGSVIATERLCMLGSPEVFEI
jgi:hypothetical protein